MVASPLILASTGGAFVDLDDREVGAALSVLDRAVSYAGRGARIDGLDEAALGPVDRYRIDRTVARVREVGAARNDADGIHFARDLEYVRREIIEEKYPPPNAMRLFPSRGDIPLGARSLIIRRGSMNGEAAVYRDGMRIPQVGIASDEESIPVRYVAVAWTENYFDSLSSAYAGSDSRGRKMRAARMAIEDKINRLAWFGSSLHGIRGILTYPYLDKAVENVVTFDGASSADDMIARLNHWANRQSNASKAVFSPNALITSPRIRSLLFSTPRSSLSDKTVGQWWLENNGRITRIEEAYELQGAGPGGTDGLLFYRAEPRSAALEFVGGLNTLPVQRDQFVDVQIMFQGFAGVNMEEPASNLLVWGVGPSV